MRVSRSDELHPHTHVKNTAYPINICLLLSKAEMSQTLVLDFLQQLILKQRFDSRVLVRLVVRVLLPQSLHIFVGQETGSEVLGAQVCSGPLGAIRFGGRRRMVSGDLLPLGLRRAGSGTAFSIHDEISEVWYEKRADTRVDATLLSAEAWEWKGGTTRRVVVQERKKEGEDPWAQKIYREKARQGRPVGICEGWRSLYNSRS